MANNRYNIGVLTASGDATLTDDGTGIDELFFQSVTFQTATDIRLSYFVSSGVSIQASAFYFTNGGPAYRLVVNGLIENVRGSNSADFIGGNEVNNLLYGDALATGPGGNDTITGEEGNDSIYGGAGNDELNGEVGNDRLFGDAGVDIISGASGIDVIEGGAGADSLYGGADAGDTVSYLASGAGVRIDITFGQTTTGAGGHATGDQIAGFTNVSGSGLGDVIRDTVAGTVAFGGNRNRFDGNAGNDVLSLGGGNDVARGGEGNDTITGGAGADLLAGNAGADRFVFSLPGDSTAASAGRDTIADFDRAEGDRIDLRGIDAVAGGVNNAFTYIGLNGFSGAAGELRVVANGTGFLVQGTVNADKIADFSIQVQNLSAIGAVDFLL